MLAVENLVRSLLFAGFISLLVGCASLGEVMRPNSAQDLYPLPVGSFPSRTYAASLEEVKQAAIISLQEAGLENITENQTADAVWFVVGEVGYSWRSNGQFVRIAARPDTQSESPRTDVFYNSIKRFDANVTEDLVAVQEKLLNLMDAYIESL